ncbi:TPA: hypothetical protein ACS7WW_003594 [Providencia alcalifaciens]
MAKNTFEITIRLFHEGNSNDVGIDMGFSLPDENYDPAFLAAVYALRAEMLARKISWLNESSSIVDSIKSKQKVTRSLWTNLQDQMGSGGLCK